MRTYDERLNNIRAKADANKKAKRAIAATVVVLSVFVLLIGSVILWPELLFGARCEPTMGSVLQQPLLSDAPTVNTAPTGSNEPDEPDIMETIPTSPTVPAPTEPNVTEPVSPEDVIEFHSKYVKCYSGSNYSWGPVIIRSKEELELLYKREVAQFEDWILEFDPIASVREQINQYDDTFFEKQSLILLMTPESSGGNTLDVTELFWIGDRVSVTIDRDTSGMTCDMAYWYVFIETDQVLAENTDVRVQYKVNGYVELSPLETISFKTQNIYYGAPDMDAKYPKVDVIASVEELQAYLSNLEQDLSVETSGYDAAFFDQYTLLALWNPVGSSSEDYRVTEVWRMSDGGISIHCQQNSPDVCDDDVMSWLIFIESAETISHYAKISVDYITAPEPETPTESQKITFSVEIFDIFDGVVPGPTIIHSYDELQTLKEQYPPNSKLYQKLHQYDAAFFENNALVFMDYYDLLSGYDYQVKSVWKLPDGNIRVEILRLYWECLGEATSHDTVLIEINTSVSDVSQVSVETTTVLEGWKPESPETCYPLIVVENGQAYIMGAYSSSRGYCSACDFRYDDKWLHEYYGLEMDAAVTSPIINMELPLFFQGNSGSFTAHAIGMTVNGEYATDNFWVKLQLDCEIPDGVYFGSYSCVDIWPDAISYDDEIYVDMDFDGDMNTISYQLFWDYTSNCPVYSVFIDDIPKLLITLPSADYNLQNFLIIVADVNQDGIYELIVYKDYDKDFYRGIIVYILVSSSNTYSSGLNYTISRMP